MRSYQPEIFKKKTPLQFVHSHPQLIENIYQTFEKNIFENSLNLKKNHRFLPSSPHKRELAKRQGSSLPKSSKHNKNNAVSKVFNDCKFC